MKITRATALFSLVAIAIVFSSAPAFAKCKDKDLKGTWYVYVSDLNAEGWERCKIKLTSSGRVTGSYCKLSDGEKSDIDGGRLDISSSCKVTGTIDFEEGVIAVIRQAHMHSTKEEISGVGYNNYGVLFSLTAIKP